MSTGQVYELTPHARRRCLDEQVEPQDVLAALQEEHPTMRNAANAIDHYVRIRGEEFRVVAKGTGVVLTLHRRIRDKTLRRDMRAISRRTRQINRMDRRRARR